MLDTLSGILTDIRLLQFSNAELPISVTPSGIIIEVGLLQSLNASFPIFVTPSGMTTLLFVPRYLHNTFSSIIKSLPSISSDCVSLIESFPLLVSSSGIKHVLTLFNCERSCFLISVLLIGSMVFCFSKYSTSSLFISICISSSVNGQKPLTNICPSSVTPITASKTDLIVFTAGHFSTGVC